MEIICAQCGEIYEYEYLKKNCRPDEFEGFVRGWHCGRCIYEPELRSGEFRNEHFRTLIQASNDPDILLLAVSGLHIDPPAS